MDEDWSYFESIDENEKVITNLDIELIKKEVGKRFSFYDLKIDTNAVAFFCRVNTETLDEDFESLRVSLSKKEYIPIIRYERGEHIIYVIRKPKTRIRSKWVNVALFLATIFTTILAGSMLFASGEQFNWSNIFELNNIFNGWLFFSFPLMSILGIHELGHYFASKRHKIRTTLPYFIPFPPNPYLPLGTMGAVISTKEPIPNRKALLDIGIAGPICGFLVALPVLLIGLKMSTVIPISDIPEGSVILGEPLLVTALIKIMFNLPVGYTLTLHPTAFAGWVGLLVTAINLLPAGQLDGGHIARAVLKEKHKYVSWGAMIALFGLGLVATNWLFFAILILFLIGIQHPPPLNELTSLDIKRKLLAIIALLIFILSFVPIIIVP
jgi:membrane-associated protease RseP (regulator of RpoE activity)